MDRSTAPPEIVELAERRTHAREARDWATADELRARIEAAGWRVVDLGTAFELSPARPADIIEGGEVRYGAPESVPSRLDEPASGRATYVVIADTAGLAAETLEALAAHRGPETQVVVVEHPAEPIDGPADEVIRTVEPFGPGEALTAALRRASGSLVVVLEPGAEPSGEILPPLEEALADPGVAVAGSEGLWSSDLHRYHPAGVGDVTTLGSACYAFRRADAIALGRLDDRLHLRGSLAAWLGLALRDRGADAAPRRAVAIELPLRVRDMDDELPADHARRVRRDAYRLADRFRGRRWLGAEEPPEGRIVGDGAEGDGHGDDASERGDTGPA